MILTDTEISINLEVHCIYYNNCIYCNNLSLNGIKEKQNEMLSLINQLAKKTNIDKPGRPYSEKNKKSIKEVVNNAKQFYETKDDIIDAFEDIRNVKKEQTKEVNLDWLKYPDIFKKLVKDIKFNANLNVIFGENKGKRVNLKNVKKYLDGI